MVNYQCSYWTVLWTVGRRRLLTINAENSSIIGGLGEAVAGVLFRNGVTPTFRQIALSTHVVMPLIVTKKAGRPRS